MLVVKQVADLITSVRFVIALCLVWVGIVWGVDGLSIVAWLMLGNWMGDMMDGRIARRSRVQYHTWIGDHDLEVDMTVSGGLLAFLIQAGFVNAWLAGAYLLLWAAYFWWQGSIPHSQGMLFQAPVYGWFIWVALHEAPPAGWAIVIFLSLLIVVTWPYFPKVMVPGFLDGLFHKQDRYSLHQ
jgi:hypothetical protein